LTWRISFNLEWCVSIQATTLVSTLFSIVLATFWVTSRKTKKTWGVSEKKLSYVTRKDIIPGKHVSQRDLSDCIKIFHLNPFFQLLFASLGFRFFVPCRQTVAVRGKSYLEKILIINTSITVSWDISL
jgi:hypothetical protein